MTELDENPNQIQFTPDKLRKLEREYRKAVETGAESFVFEGNELLVSYAKYLIEYLKSQFGRQQQSNPPGDPDVEFHSVDLGPGNTRYVFELKSEKARKWLKFLCRERSSCPNKITVNAAQFNTVIRHIERSGLTIQNRQVARNPLEELPLEMNFTSISRDADVEVEDHGSIWLFDLLTQEAKDWVVNNVGGEVSYHGRKLAVEARYVDALISGMEGDGLTVQFANPAMQTEKCYACGRKIHGTKHPVRTSDGQLQYVGIECYRKIKQGGESGYQPPLGGPVLFTDESFSGEKQDNPLADWQEELRKWEAKYIDAAGRYVGPPVSKYIGSTPSRELGEGDYVPVNERYSAMLAFKAAWPGEHWENPPVAENYAKVDVEAYQMRGGRVVPWSDSGGVARDSKKTLVSFEFKTPEAFTWISSKGGESFTLGMRPDLNVAMAYDDAMDVIRQMKKDGLIVSTGGHQIGENPPTAHNAPRAKHPVKVSDYELIDHGIEHEQYFQGCGVAFTGFDSCVTGAGDNFAEALEDALEQLALAGISITDPVTKRLEDIDIDTEDLEERINQDYFHPWQGKTGPLFQGAGPLPPMQGQLFPKYQPWPTKPSAFEQCKESDDFDEENDSCELHYYVSLRVKV